MFKTVVETRYIASLHFAEDTLSHLYKLFRLRNDDNLLVIPTDKNSRN
ncbi:MAG: hypothetical protein WBF90_22175 [Rivularia sp. (in: cyanobacteria)]